MAAFEKDVLESTAETDPREQQKRQDALLRQAKKMQQQFGVQQQAGTPRIGIGTAAGYEKAATQSRLDEFNRRKAAARTAYELGGKIDARRSQLDDEMQAAIKERQRAIEKGATAQAHQDRENNLALQQAVKPAEDKMKELNFSLYKSNAERRAALQSAIRAGDAEKQMIDAAAENNLKQQDIENYFSMLKAQLDMEYEKTKSGNQQDWQDYQNKLTNEANNWAKIFEGSTTLSTSAYKWFQ